VWVVACVTLSLCWHSVSAASATAKRGGAFYDHPDYDFGLGESFPLPNQARGNRRWRAADRSRGSHHHHWRPPSNAASSLAEIRSEMHRRDAPRSVFNFPSAIPTVSYGADPHIGAPSGGDNFFSFAETKASVDASAAVPDDPFSGPAADGMRSIPVQISKIEMPKPFESPAFTEVMSQIKEIVAFPKDNPTPGNLRHIISSVVDRPMMTPPSDPPPVPTSFNKGPPLPALIETTQKLKVNSPTSFASLPVVSPDASMSPSLISVSSSVTPHGQSIQQSAEPEAQKMRFKLELASTSSTQQQEAPAKPVETHVSEARAFIEEMAGMKKHVEQRRGPIVVPPPLMARQRKPLSKFRVWE